MSRVARAFTLIEVLIAVFVLALGLLGIGAVFPVVVRQQRMAQDAVQGVTVARNAIAFLEGNHALNEASLNPPTSPSNRRGWDIWLKSSKWAPIFGKAQNSAGWRGWVDLDVDLSVPNVSDVFGALRVRGDDPNIVVRIPVSQRLWPAPFTPGVEPQFVWDFVARRYDPIPDGGPLMPNDVDDDLLEVAVFVRRVDPGIKVVSSNNRRQNFTLSYALQARNRLLRSPVGIRANGTPSFDGTDGAGGVSYAGTYALEVEDLGLDETEYKTPLRLRLKPSTKFPNALRLAAQPGQKLLDNYGNIYTVVRLADTPDKATVILERPVPNDIAQRLVSTGPLNRVQVVFTPQVPVAVVLKRIQR